MAAKPHGIILTSLLLSTAAAQFPASPPPPYPYRFSSSTITIFAIVLASIFFIGVFSLFLRLCCDSSSANPFLSNSHRRASTGLDIASINSLPVILYSEIKEHTIGNGALECAICLNEFEDDETLRLIPKCDHVFHPECINPWLELHVTCPVCRADLVPEPDLTNTDSSHHDTVSPLELPDRETFSVRIDQPDPSVQDETLDRRAKLLGKFSRSHSTGHSLVVIVPGESTERFTLRLPDHIREEVLARALIRANITEESNRREWRVEEGSDRGVSRSYKRLVKSDRWPVLPGEGCRPAIKLPVFKCLGPTRPSTSDDGTGLVNVSPVRAEV